MHAHRANDTCYTLVSLMDILMICSNCRFTQKLFHRTSLVLGMSQYVFWGASKFFGGPVSFLGGQ